MSVADFKVVYSNELVVSTERLVASGAVATINNGEPTKQGTSGAVLPMADGDGTTSQLFTGIAVSVSTDTVSASGTVFVLNPLPGIVYSGSPKVAGSCNTVAKIQALQGKRVVFDLTSSKYTIDTAAGDASTNAVVIIGGDYQTDTAYFIVAVNGSIFGE